MRERETLRLNPRLLAKVRRHGGADMQRSSLVKSSVWNVFEAPEGN